ncbi:MAG: cupredoxin domain-containing protein [Acidimicrobiia bacterium]|nr:cupredoxin domain-containing protein [Acidimicrobiia bacterium]
MRPPTSPLPPRPTFLNDAAMVFLRTAGAAALLCLLYLVFGNERTGFILLGGLSMAAIAAGVITVLAYRGQLAEEMITAPADEPPAVRTVRWSPLPAPSGTPFAGAAAIVLLSVGALYGVSLTIVGILVALITVITVSTVLQGEHRGRTVNLLPFAIPIVALAVIATFMFLMSRMLLAVNHDISVIVAIGVAILILIGGFLVANTPQVPTRTLVRVGAGLALLFGAGGLAAYGVGQRPEERKAGPPPVTVVAQNISFVQKHLNFEAGAVTTVTFKNDDKVPHNMDFTVDQQGTQTFYKQDPLPGPISSTYQFTAPKAGTYYYHCDVHPNMTGSVTIKGTGGGEPGQAAAPKPTPASSEAPTSAPPPTKAPAAAPSGGGNTSANLDAKSISFVQKTLTLKADSPVVIHFNNQDAGIPHNVDITTDQGGSNTLYKQDPVTGPATEDYKFTTQGPGKLYFHCDVHPNMTGTINVQ